MLDVQSLFDDLMVEDDLEVDSLDVKTVRIQAQFILDGATTLSEAADAARAYADYLDDLADDGYELSSFIQDDMGFASLTTEW